MVRAVHRFAHVSKLSSANEPKTATDAGGGPVSLERVRYDCDSPLLQGGVAARINDSQNARRRGGLVEKPNHRGLTRPPRRADLSVARHLIYRRSAPPRRRGLSRASSSCTRSYFLTRQCYANGFQRPPLPPGATHFGSPGCPETGTTNTAGTTYGLCCP